MAREPIVSEFSSLELTANQQVLQVLPAYNTRTLRQYILTGFSLANLSPYPLNISIGIERSATVTKLIENFNINAQYTYPNIVGLQSGDKLIVDINSIDEDPINSWTQGNQASWQNIEITTTSFLDLLATDPNTPVADGMATASITTEG